MAIVVYDLDGTVIDSSHRVAAKPEHMTFLEYWKAHCQTREMIMGDRLLPLAKSMRATYDAGHTNVICTARVLSMHDYEFLVKHDLRFHHCLSRGGETDNRPDGALKVALLQNFMRAYYGTHSLRGVIMFDDNVKVIEAMTHYGVSIFDATKQNERLIA